MKSVVTLFLILVKVTSIKLKPLSFWHYTDQNFIYLPMVLAISLLNIAFLPGLTGRL